jgi:hypothetical protein
MPLTLVDGGIMINRTMVTTIVTRVARGNRRCSEIAILLDADKPAPRPISRVTSTLTFRSEY